MAWKIEQLNRRTADGAVLSADWRCTRTDLEDETLSATCIGVQELPEADPESPEFIPYADITEADAVAWVKDALGAERVAEIEAALDAEIEQKRAPQTATGLPWA